MGSSSKKGRTNSPPVEEMPVLSKPRASRVVYFISGGLALATIVVYAQVYTHGFQVLDDDSYVLQNAIVTAGLTGPGVRWALTTGAIANWHPLTWMSHMLDCQLFGVNAGPHHLVNVLFHTLSTVLLFLALRRLTGMTWRSAFVAGLFALHPIHVESVAWISERKDVLSAFFWMLTMGGYALYVERPSVRRYGLVLVPFALGLMAKPMLVTLPCVLLLLDYWPLRRFEPVAVSKKGVKPPNYAMIIAEKLPLFALTIASSFITFVVQQRGGAVLSLEAITPWARVANALVSYVCYVSKMIWPQRLAIYYPSRAESLLVWQGAVALLVLAAVSAALVYGRKRYPFLLVGWLWYVGTLVPVIGIIQVGTQAMADRYTYIPAIGVFIMVAWGVPELAARWPAISRKSPEWRCPKPVLGAAAAAVLLGMSISTTFYLRDWRDSEKLFAHALASTTENDVAHFNEGIALKRLGRLDEADTHFLEAIRIKPSYSLARIYAGLIRYEQGRFDESIEYYRTAIEYAAGTPETAADAENNLGAVLQAQGKSEEAAAHFLKAVQLKPDYADAHFNLGANLARAGRVDEAMAHFRETLRIVPTHEQARKELERLAASAPKAPMPSTGGQPQSPNLGTPSPSSATGTNPQTAEEHYAAGNALAQQSRFQEAEEQYKQAIRLRPDYTDARVNLGNALASQGKLREASAEFQAVLKADPQNVSTHINLGNVLNELGELGESAAHYAKALDIDPNNVDACFSLGYTQAKQGKLEKAAQSFARVLSIDPSHKAAREALKQVEEAIKRQ